jgi:hypothetical protein
MQPKHLQQTIGQILELSPNPTQEEIKRNYKRLVKEYHPDLNKDPNAPEAMKLINKAYAIATGKEQPPQQPMPPQQPTYTVTYSYGTYNSSNPFGGGWGGTSSW